MTVETWTFGEPERQSIALMESVKDYAIFLLDRQGYVLSWNEGARAIKQYEPGEIIGQHFSNFYTAEDRAAGRPMRLLGIAEAEGRVEDEGWRVRKDGALFWADVVITAVKGRDGRINGFVKVTRDLTERKQNEERLRESEERMRLFVEAVRDYAIFVLDPDGRIASWNSGAEHIKGYRAEEVMGRHFSLFYPPEDVAAGKPAWELEVATREGRVEDEGWRVRKDGSRLWANVVITALRDKQGRLAGFTKVTRDLTGRRAAEEALRHSEESLSATLNSIGDGVISTDNLARVTRLNPVAERLTGWTQAEAAGQPIGQVFNIINEYTRRPAENPVSRVIAEGVVIGLANHTSLIARDGTERPIADSGAPIRDKTGEIRGAVLVFRDVSEEHSAAEALRQREEQLRLMVACIRDYAIFMLDPEGRVASWNPGAEHIKGYRAEEIIGSHISRFYPPEDAGEPAHELELAAREGRAEAEGWRVRKDGSRFWANTVISAIRDEQGRLVGFTKVTRDMTERKRTEEELARRAVQQEAVAELGVHAIRTRALQRLLERAVDLVVKTLGTDRCGVFELQPGGERLVLRAGAGWAESLIGQAALPVDGELLAGLSPRVDGPAVVGDRSDDGRFEIPPLLAELGAVSGVSVVIPVSGEEQPYGILGAHTTRPMSFSRDDVNFLRSVANVIANAIARARDEAQLRVAERIAEEERQRTARAEEALRERDVFLSAAAHELRTPLTALQLKLQVLEQMVGKDLAGTPRAATAQRRFGDALRQTHRLSELIERMLDVSRIAVDQLEMSFGPVDLEPVVRDAVQDFQEKAGQSQTAIRVDVAGDTRGEWDRNRLEQVALNLISNAVKYGGGKPVDVRIEGGDGEVKLSVTDQGIGIPEGALTRIFNPFERAVPIEHFAGLGLGLYVTRHIVEAHGGRIEVTSTPGHGATFVVLLPRSRMPAIPV